MGIARIMEPSFRIRRGLCEKLLRAQGLGSKVLGYKQKSGILLPAIDLPKNAMGTLL